MWALLAFLVYRGIAAMRTREVSPYRVLIVPAVFFVWGASSLVEKSDGLALNVAAFVAALLVGAAAGRALGLAHAGAPPRAGHGTAGDAGIAGRLDSQLRRLRREICRRSRLGADFGRRRATLRSRAWWSRSAVCSPDCSGAARSASSSAPCRPMGGPRLSAPSSRSLLARGADELGGAR